MKLGEILNLLEADLIVGEDKLDMEIDRAFAADLMSDVFAFAKKGSLLLTGLTDQIVVRTADDMGLSAVVFVRGKRPVDAAVELASEKGIPLISTRYIMFETSGRLFARGVKGAITKVEQG
ncbi:MAG: hypothetical protein DRG37_07155 [Deltaproteobacteria bacterium]|nr:MAG: hypothetical protein DRG37_07155 [Deltaproteobacteria bacterium]